MNEASLLSALEALLFMSGEPIDITRLAKILAHSKEEVTAALDVLGTQLHEGEHRGLLLLFHEDTVQLVTKPTNALFIEQLTKMTLQASLSKAALEVLAIVAYRSPVSRVEIDAIRGVNCSFTLRNLLLRDLISREGNSYEHRGYVYRPTIKLLQFLGIERIDQLPEYEALSQDERLRLLLDQDQEESKEGTSLSSEQNMAQ